MDRGGGGVDKRYIYLEREREGYAWHLTFLLVRFNMHELVTVESFNSVERLRFAFLFFFLLPRQSLSARVKVFVPVDWNRLTPCSFHSPSPFLYTSTLPQKSR